MSLKNSKVLGMKTQYTWIVILIIVVIIGRIIPFKVSYSMFLKDFIYFLLASIIFTGLGIYAFINGIKQVQKDSLLLSIKKLLIATCFIFIGIVTTVNKTIPFVIDLAAIASNNHQWVNGYVTRITSEYYGNYLNYKVAILDDIKEETYEVIFSGWQLKKLEDKEHVWARYLPHSKYLVDFEFLYD